ncbi:hypothetical protein AB0912_15410 [Streptomyces sp. NPDC007084]|uniref:hypothetical protein n=1 Tax=Streptomyces sp. NPDC007084 TaxID=3154313 RepID=UPI0034533F64
MPDSTPATVDLLRRTESYLSALHGAVARHDNLAAGLGCAGCELRDQIGEALLAAATVPAPATTDRVALVDLAAQSIRDSNGSPDALEWWRTHPQLIPAHVYADAVLAVLLAPTGRKAGRHPTAPPEDRMTANPMIATDRVLQEVLAERVRQDERWGEQNHPDGTALTEDRDRANRARHVCESMARMGQLTWRDVLHEEEQEAFAESDPAKLRAELVQVAAVAVAWIAAIDRRTA